MRSNSIGSQSTLNQAMRISSAGLTTERFRMDVISSNIANANDEATPTRQPYRRRLVQIVDSPDGPQVVGVVQDQSEFKTKLDPKNPAADSQGRVAVSNIEPINEMVDMISASRAYEANVEAFNSAKSMIRNALDIGKA